jgi:hypothetical protein
MLWIMYFFFPQESDETGTDSDSSDSDEIGMDEPDQRVEMPSGSGGASRPTKSLVPALPVPPVGSNPSSSAAPKAPGVEQALIPASSEPKPAIAVAKAKPVEGAYWGFKNICIN